MLIRVSCRICSLYERSLIVNLLTLLHEHRKVVSLALLWCLSTLQVLFCDLLPVAKATLHDALDQADFLEGAPINCQEREIKVVEYIISVRVLMHRISF